MLVKSPLSRLSKYVQIKSHPWFSGFNWEALINMDMPVPYKPKFEADPDINLAPYVNHIAKIKKYKPSGAKLISSIKQAEFDSWFRNF